MIDRRSFLAGSGAGLVTLLGDRSVFAAALASLSPAGTAARALKDEYLLAPGLLYLNHGSIGTIPRPVIDEHIRLLRQCETNPHIHMWGDVWTEALTRTRTAAAGLLHCEPDEVALTHNTTEGFNVLAQGLPLGAGDEVLFSSLNHPSASAAWVYYAPRRGYTVRRFDIPLEDITGLSVPDVVAIHEREIRPNTRVLVFPHIDNIVGLRHPTRELAAMAKRRGVRFVAVDIAQSLGMVPVDVTAEDADFYGASPHKWVQAPKGQGLLVVRRRVRDLLDPLWVKRQRSVMPKTAEVFEDYSTRDLPAVLALGDAIAFQQKLGESAKEKRLLEIAGWFRERVDATPTLAWRSARHPALSSSLFAVGIRNGDARDVERKLASRNIMVRPFGPPLNTLRVSPNLINEPTDVDRFVEAVTS
ncbi:MAG TPA: aminotransferase class V-fold PLP-dependent enzyme [Gemmatimonadaceae bacterium]|nr:aminotransferase class V-fold PLP-dependent enzyme [Gemmatimonadaceae bacterium]